MAVKKYTFLFTLADGTTHRIPIEIPVGEPGGYYTPVTEQISDTEFRVSFVPSKDGMPAVDPVEIYSFSPRVKVTDGEEGVTLSVEDYIGETEALIRHGKNGKTPVKGTDYTDGYSPSVVVSETDAGIKITVTDINGTTEAIIPVIGDKVWDCVITSSHRPPFIKWGNTNISFSVVSGSLLNVWNKVHRGEKPNVLFRYIGETEGDFFNYFMEAEYVEHIGVGSTPEMLKINFLGDGEILTFTSNNQSDITNNRITSYTVTPSSGKDGTNGTNGTNGYSIYYMNEEVEYPYEGFKTFSVSKENLSNNGSNIKVGDILISSNGVLCNVYSIQPYSVNFIPVAKIGGGGNGSGGKADFVVQDTPPEDKSVLWVDPTDNTEDEIPDSGGNVDYGAENAGKLLYVGADGFATVLTLGAGLAIVNGVLTITSQVVASAICGQAVCGNAICGGA